MDLTTSINMDTRKITAGRSVRQPEQYEHLYIEDVFATVKHGIYHDQLLSERIEDIRAEQNPEIAKNLKQGLPFFTGSYYEGSRRNANVQYAVYAIIDLDHVADIPKVKRLVMEQLPSALCAFQSVNDGVKIIILLNPAIADETHYRVAYELLRQKIKEITGIMPDSTPDWARACFFSYDPELLYNPDCVGFSCELPLPAKPSKPAPGQPQAVTFKLPPSEDDYARAELVIKALSTMYIRYEDWIKTGLALKAAFGERGKALWLLYENNPNYSDDTRELERKWRSFGYTGSVGIGSLFYVGERYGIC